MAYPKSFAAWVGSTGTRRRTGRIPNSLGSSIDWVINRLVEMSAGSIEINGQDTGSMGGVCERIGSSGTTDELYQYSYGGAPFTGTDCCAFKIDSFQSGVTGAGQAIFFHNLDASNPANHPPDTDGDGMRDGCDNCAGIPNGPYLGSCIGLAGVGGTCLSDLECGQYEYCSLAQEDVDVDGAGDACSVPEPGFGVGLIVGLGGLAAFGGKRRRRSG